MVGGHQSIEAKTQMQRRTIAKLTIALALMFVIIAPTYARPLVPVQQTIPPVVSSSNTAIPGCSELTTYFGGVIENTVGFILATCPNNHPAMLFGIATEAPSFLLATGFDQISIMYYTFPCNFNFLPSNSNRLVGANITSGAGITFTGASNSTSQLLSGGYNYCLHYTNPPNTGIGSFSISWTP